MEDQYNESWGVKRRIVQIALTKTPSQLAEGIEKTDAETYGTLLDCFNEFKEHCKAGIELAESASARMLAVGMYIVEKNEVQK